MNAVDGSRHFEQQDSSDQDASLLVVILDTNPAAWSLISGNLSLSQAVGSLLILLNAHLACNYSNKVAVIASHCDVATWLYPATASQHASNSPKVKRNIDDGSRTAMEQSPRAAKRNKGDAYDQETQMAGTRNGGGDMRSNNHGGKYPVFRQLEEELLANLSKLLASTNPATIFSTASTRLAGAFSLALSYINRQSINLDEVNGRAAHPTDAAAGSSVGGSKSSSLDARILLISASQSHDLANQYISIMNSIFACQRLSIPIDICQISSSATTSDSTNAIKPSDQASSAPKNALPPALPAPNRSSSSSSTVFLQQASDATRGIYIPLDTPPHIHRHHFPSTFLQTLMMAFLPSRASRIHLSSPTRVDVDFRAACFCHRRVVDLGFVCSICLSIFCSVPPPPPPSSPSPSSNSHNGRSNAVIKETRCLTCQTRLDVGDYGGRPIVVPPARGQQQQQQQQEQQSHQQRTKKKRKDRAVLVGSE